MARKKRWFHFQVLFQYTTGTPKGTKQIHTLGVVRIEQQGNESVGELADRAVVELLNQPAHYKEKELVEVGGAKVWAKAID